MKILEVFPAKVLDECIENGWCEVFKDAAGAERVRVTPKGLRGIGVSEEEIARVVESERRAGRPYRSKGDA